MNFSTLTLTALSLFAFACGGEHDLTTDEAAATASGSTTFVASSDGEEDNWCCTRCGASVGSDCTQAAADGSCSRSACFLACDCGETVQNGTVTCHACGDERSGDTLTSGDTTREGQTQSGSFVSNEGPLEDRWCCDSCPGTGSGSGCGQAGGANSCLPNECYLNCACGETQQNGGVTCHAC
jgi:hypothetical protein